MADVEITTAVDNRGLQQGVREGQQSIRNFQRESLAELRRFARRGAAVLGTAAAAFALLTRESAQYVQNLQSGARASRVAVSEYQKIAAVLEALGRDSDSAVDALQDLQDRIQELRDGTSSFIDDFALLNLTVADFAGLAPDEALLRLSRAVNETGDATRALAAAARILPEFQQILGDVATTYDELIPRLERTGGIIEDTDIARLNQDYQVLSATIRAQFIEGLKALNLEAESTDEVIAAIGEGVREFTTEIAGLATGFGQQVQPIIEFLGDVEDALNSVNDAGNRVAQSINDIFTGAGGFGFNPNRFRGGSGVTARAGVVDDTDEVIAAQQQQVEATEQASQSILEFAGRSGAAAEMEIQQRVELSRILADAIRQQQEINAQRDPVRARGPGTTGLDLQAAGADAQPIGGGEIVNFFDVLAEQDEAQDAFAAGLGDFLTDAVSLVNYEDPADALAQLLLTRFLQNALSELGSLAGGGGFSFGNLIPSFHDGGVFRAPPGRREGLAILQDGEPVLTPDMLGSGIGGSLTVHATFAGRFTERERSEFLDGMLPEFSRRVQSDWENRGVF